MLDARSRRAAWIVAGAASGIAALEAVAIAMMMPLKTVQPITLLVDRQTGFTQALDPQSPMRITADEALTNAYLAQYVMAREGFDRATVSADYRKVALWSTGVARSSYLAQMPVANPGSPLNRYAGGTTVTARVKSVSRLSGNTALVRFDTQFQDRNGQLIVPQQWISVIRYRYVDAPMRMEDRLANPLGFQVLSYRRSAEAPETTGQSHVVSVRPLGDAPSGLGGELKGTVNDRLPDRQRPSGSPLDRAEEIRRVAQ